MRCPDSQPRTLKSIRHQNKGKDKGLAISGPREPWDFWKDLPSRLAKPHNDGIWCRVENKKHKKHENGWLGSVQTDAVLVLLLVRIWDISTLAISNGQIVAGGLALMECGNPFLRVLFLQPVERLPGIHLRVSSRVESSAFGAGDHALHM